MSATACYRQMTPRFKANTQPSQEWFTTLALWDAAIC